MQEEARKIGFNIKTLEDTDYSTNPEVRQEGISYTDGFNSGLYPVKDCSYHLIPAIS